MRKVQNYVRVDMPGDLQMLLLNVAFSTLLMQRLLGQQATKILVSCGNSFPTFYLVLNISNIRENSSEPQCLDPNQQHSPWPWIVSAVMRYT